jgi:hypothetical protein
MKNLEATNDCRARVLSRGFPTTQIEIDALKQLALLCGAGLLVSLLLMTYGLDLNPGFSDSLLTHNASAPAMRRRSHF